jgi:adenylate cyclase class 2
LSYRETEIKLPLDSSPAAIRRRLQGLGGAVVHRRHLEDNFILDLPDGRIRRRRCLLRIRFTGSMRGLLTFKGPGRILRQTKSRLEIESALDDGPAALEVFSRIGLRPRFRYQKYRTLFRLGPLQIALDETPIGNYLEIEGPPSRIHAAARRLGFTPDSFITTSYRELFFEYRRQNHMRSRHMLFDIQES